MSSKASRWVLVGSASTGTVARVPANRTWLRVEGGQVGEQAAVAVEGGRLGCAWLAALVLARGERRAGVTGSAGGGMPWSVKVGRRRQAQVPGEVAGEHADQHVGADPAARRW